MKQEFECHPNCGQCCDRQVSMIDGKEFGMYLSPDEVERFPEASVFPIFRKGGKVFAYQMGQHLCPNLIVEEGRKSCGIYERRPLVCRAFPAAYDNGCFIILSDKCPYTPMDVSYDKCFQAVREQIEQAKNSPQATEMFILNGHKWVTL